jgi:broad specificity phosphatase PhoE
MIPVRLRALNATRHPLLHRSDIYPINFEDMKAQRQLSEKGRAMARQIGSVTRELRIPIGTVYTSKLDRAIEKGRLLPGKDVIPRRCVDR